MAIYAQRGASFEATCQGFSTGLVGTLGVRVLDNTGGTTLARTTSGITELVPASGFYGVTLIAPTIQGEYSIVWDDTGSGPGHTAAETLTVLLNTTVQVASGTVGMTYGEILDDVLGNPLRFETDLRARAGRSVNLRYAHVWGLEDWTFRFAIDTPTAVSTQRQLQGVAEDFGVPVYVWDPDGNELVFLEEGEFNANYGSTSVGTPVAWTVIAGTVFLGPIPQLGGVYRCYYRRRLTAMVDESSYPMLPPEYHMVLVHGGRAELLAVSDDPMTQVMEAQFERDIDAMRREYLIDAVGQPSNWPTDLSVVG